VEALAVWLWPEDHGVLVVLLHFSLPVVVVGLGMALVVLGLHSLIWVVVDGKVLTLGSGGGEALWVECSLLGIPPCSSDDVGLGLVITC